MKISPWLRYHCEVYGTLAEALVAVQDSVGEQIVYLCGGINGLSDAACKDWRQVARNALNRGPGRARFHTLDPMARDYRGREDECVDEIVDGDKEDVLASDVILVNASKPSWGTAMEIMFAWSLHKRIVAFVEVA
jgi:hypothetical protein